MDKIGVKSIDALSLIHNTEIKKDLLLFDKIILFKDSLKRSIDYAEMITRQYNLNKNNLHSQLKDIEQLEKMGVVVIEDNKLPNETALLTDKNHYINELIDFSKKSRQIQSEISHTKSLSDLTDRLKLLDSYFIRFYCNCNEMIPTDKAYIPILDKFYDEIFSNSKKKTVVFNVLLKNIPQVSEDLPLSKLIEVKSDNDLRRKYYSLINWVNSISQTGLSISELEDQYQYLYHEYCHQLNIHKLKYTQSNVEFVINTTFELLENLIKLKLSKISKLLFNLSKNEVELMEAESKIIGREVAYIFDVKKRLKLHDKNH